MCTFALTTILIDRSMLFFFCPLAVPIADTPTTVQIPPLRSIPDENNPTATPQPEEKVTNHRLRVAWKEAQEALLKTPSLVVNLWDNFRDGLLMSSAILPSILSVGLIGLLAAKLTPIFDWMGWIFVPFT